jgi:transcriptional regulator with XRE-family HTH domain
MARDLDGHFAGLARMLQRARYAAGVTQQELAHLSGVSVRTISDLETGRVIHPRHATIRSLARALRIDQEETTSLNLMARSRGNGQGPVR